jgi:hypothetical protein
LAGRAAPNEQRLLDGGELLVGSLGSAVLAAGMSGTHDLADAGGDQLGCLEEWAKAGVFDRLQLVLLDELGVAGRVDLERVSVDSFSLRAVKGGT